MSSTLSSDHIAAGEIKLEFPVHAPIARVWDALLNEVSDWWPRSFHTSERTQKFILEPKLGGMMGEVFGPDEGLVWYRVIGIEKPNSLILSGYMLPPWAGPGVSLIRLALTAVNDGETKLEFTDSTFGKVTECGTEAGWQQIFGEHFTPHVEKSA